VADRLRNTDSGQQVERLLPSDEALETLDRAQQKVVDYLDSEIDRLRDLAAPEEWETLYNSLMNEKRKEIDDLLGEVTRELEIGGRPRRIRTRLASWTKPIRTRLARWTRARNRS
jgi:hypothetical protein